MKISKIFGFSKPKTVNKNVSIVTFSDADRQKMKASSYKEGKDQFEKLSKLQKVGVIGVEQARQNYNRTLGYPKLQMKPTPLNYYVKHLVDIKNIIKDVISKKHK